MNRFLWLLRREVWEHRAIWIVPAVMLGVLLVAVLTGNVHMGPIGDMHPTTALGLLPPEKQVKLLTMVFVALALIMDMVMGVIAFFYALDSMHADRRDRSVLFWKSLPLSDAETVLSKFTVAALVIPLVAVAASLLSQLIVAGAGGAMLALEGGNAAIMFQRETLGVGISLMLLWSATAVLWYAPVIAYLMLASAWAPRGPFLWAVLPPIALLVLERFLLRTEVIEGFVAHRLTGLYDLLESQEKQVEATIAMGGKAVEADVVVTQVDLHGSLMNFYGSPGLWLGLVAAALLLGGAIWLRRYRDETS